MQGAWMLRTGSTGKTGVRLHRANVLVLQLADRIEQIAQQALA